VSSPSMVRLRDLGEWSGGNTPSKANSDYWTNGTVPWVSPKDMKVDEIVSSEDRVSDFALTDGRVSLVPEGSVLLVTRSGILVHTLPVAVTKLPVTINQDLKALTPKAGVNAKYVAHAVRGASRQILKKCSKNGTTVASIDTSALLDFEIRMVDLDEQQRIVAEIEKQFSRLDGVITDLKRVKTNLKRYKAAVFKAAVEGRLVLTEAELALREGRSYETGAQLLQRILEARRSRWKGKATSTYSEPVTVDRTDLPQLPDGWVWTTAEQISEFITKGTTPAAAKLSDGIGEVQFLKVYNLTFDGVLNQNHKPAFVSRATHEGELARSMVRAGDVLINIVGPPLGQVSVVPVDILEANINQAIARFRPVSPMTPKYLAIVLMTDKIMRWAIRRAKTTAGQANLTLEHCRQLPIPLPPLEEQARIVAEVERCFSVADRLEKQMLADLARAENIRRAVLRRVFSE